MGPTWGPPGSCRLQMGPMLAPWILLSRECIGTDNSAEESAETWEKLHNFHETITYIAISSTDMLAHMIDKIQPYFPQWMQKINARLHRHGAKQWCRKYTCITNTMTQDMQRSCVLMTNAITLSNIGSVMVIFLDGPTHIAHHHKRYSTLKLLSCST